MFNNIYRNFILNNSLAAVSAVILGENTLATDGMECLIHRFDNKGNFIEYYNTLRPYRRLRRNDDICVTTALGCCNTNRIYFLDERFNETGFIELDTLRRNGCDSIGDVTDASLTLIGDEKFIVATFPNGAFLFDMQGKRLTRLSAAENGEILTDFISMGNDVFAMGTLCGSTQAVTVSDNGRIQSGFLARGYTLRMLIPQGDDIYGLFGRSYIYNRIIKIYSQGILTLPKP